MGQSKSTYQSTTMLRFLACVLFLSKGVISTPSSSTDHKYEILSKSKPAPDSGIVEVWKALSSPVGQELECGKKCGEEDCGAFYLSDMDLRCVLVAKDSAGSYKDPSKLTTSTNFNNYFVRIY